MQRALLYAIKYLFFKISFAILAIAFAALAERYEETKGRTQQYHQRFLKGTAASSTNPASIPRSLSLNTTTSTVLLLSLSRVGNDGIPTSVFPLQKCQGDCDTDMDCYGTLKCFKRQSGDDVRLIPGCTSPTMDNLIRLTSVGTDYCYDPTDELNTTLPILINGTVSTNPVKQIEQPQQLPPKRGTIVYVGEDWKPKESYPLKVCEGDCDGDYDCAGELICFHRDKDFNTLSGGTVPGCVGRDTTTRDYCINPKDTLVKPPVINSFRLKKYWQFGYKWQDEFWEQEWCIECSNLASTESDSPTVPSACRLNDSIIISHCSHDRSTWFLYKNLKNNTTQLQIATAKNASSSSQELCLQLVGNNNIRVKVCDGTNQRQKFQSLNGMFGKTTKFEIGTKARDGCLSNQHHPKDGELIYRENCTITRKHTTSFWTQF